MEGRWRQSYEIFKQVHFFPSKNSEIIFCWVEDTVYSRYYEHTWSVNLEISHLQNMLNPKRISLMVTVNTPELGSFAKMEPDHEPK